MEPTLADPRGIPQNRPPNSVGGPPVGVSLAYTTALHAIVAVVSARFLGLLGVLGGIGIFSYAVYDPDKWRMLTAAIYCVGFLWPLCLLYWRKE